MIWKTYGKSANKVTDIMRPYGECVGVFNTSLKRAASCCDIFNEYQSRIDRAAMHLARSAEYEPESCDEWIALNAARNAATGII